MEEKKLTKGELIQQKLKCPSCNRKTSGPEEYKNIRSGNITKTCQRCRASVRESLGKTTRKRPVTQREIFGILLKLYLGMNETMLASKLDPAEITLLNEFVNE